MIILDMIFGFLLLFAGRSLFWLCVGIIGFLIGVHYAADWGFSNVNLASIPVFVGALLGAMLTYLFSSMAISAVGRAAEKVIESVRQQFKGAPSST